MIPRFLNAADTSGAEQEVLLTYGPTDVTFDRPRGFIGQHLIDTFTDVIPDCSPEQMARCSRSARRVGWSQIHRHQERRPHPAQYGLLQYFGHVQTTDGFPRQPASDAVLASLAALGANPVRYGYAEWATSCSEPPRPSKCSAQLG